MVQILSAIIIRVTLHYVHIAHICDLVPLADDHDEHAAHAAHSQNTHTQSWTPHQPLYWLWRIHQPLSTTKNDFNYLYQLLWCDARCKWISMASNNKFSTTEAETLLNIISVDLEFKLSLFRVEGPICRQYNNLLIMIYYDDNFTV